ncbi:MAG: tetratricopeptide repeat protein [Thermoanaerobaculia bacterium]|nr:tetratricopeptide repeat protein [Thermoanaerobaculia bacterium]
MRRRNLILVLSAGLVVAAAVTVPFLLRARATEWTTKSPAALAAFEAGLDARMRFYLLDAAADFRQALALDPSFAAAKVQLAAVTVDGEERKRLRKELEVMDVSALGERERFLVEMARSKRELLPELSASYLARHPRDPWGLYVAAGQAWDREDFTAAADLYRRLLEVDPNWVLARNNLAYLAMAQAQFAQAEEQLRTYAYVAPDQANPHDSLGELLSLVGRYDEARAELERAIAIRPDFCASYQHLAGIAIFEGKPEEIPPLAARLAKNCPPEMGAALECEGRFFAAFIAKDFDAPWRDGFASCAGKPGGRGILFYRLALLAGRTAEADAEDVVLAKLVEESRKSGYGKSKARSLQVEALHEQGLRKLADGDARAAAGLFRAADERASYWGVDEGRTRLFNKLNLALALDRAGEAGESAAVLASVSAVNPAFAEVYASLPERTPGPR